jgi:hypothetical protein
VGVAALLVRLRRTRGAEHQQVKWFINTVVVVVVVLFIQTMQPTRLSLWLRLQVHR